MAQFDPEKEEDETRIENIKELLRVAADWDESNTNDKDLIDFLSETTLVTDTEDAENDQKVSLMTTHSSKGLEFPCVFIIGMEEGIFPHGRSLGNPKELEEERRLAYVAMTRAERKLFITHCNNRYEYNDPRPRRNRPSRFISEIPEELIKRIG
jgi:DNA helicase-2/ATP-dependent DNA helicase PcrA